jgi:hypothetical protein
MFPDQQRNGSDLITMMSRLYMNPVICYRRSICEILCTTVNVSLNYVLKRVSYVMF